MKINIKEIFEGWKNHLLPKEDLKEKIDEVSQYRIKICRQGPCEFHSSRHNTWRTDEHCTECGCPIVVKSKCLSCKCGIGKWREELTEEEESLININNE